MVVGPVPPALAGVKQGADARKVDAHQLKAARDFEAVFLRKMLSELEKTGQSKGSVSSSGGSVYGSMMVGALADSLAAQGGIGLAQLMVDALETRGARAAEGSAAQIAQEAPSEKVSGMPSHVAPVSMDAKRQNVSQASLPGAVHPVGSSPGTAP